MRSMLTLLLLIDFVDFTVDEFVKDCHADEYDYDACDVLIHRMPP
jgi:hypothetical protein